MNGGLENLRLLTTIITSVIFSFIPGIASIICYARIAKRLLRSKKKVSRNLNLVMAFGVSSAIWFLCWTFNLIFQSYSFYITKYVQFYEAHKYFLYSNITSVHLMDKVSGLTSIVNPFLLLIILQNYRKPAINFVKKIKNFIEKAARLFS